MLSPDRLPLAVRGGLLLLIIVAVLHTLDRQGEFVSRTDFLWKAKLKVEQEEVETMRGINKVIFSSSLLFSARFSVISFRSLFNFFFGCACLDSTFPCFTQQHPLAAVLVSVTKQSTNLPQIPQIHNFLTLLHWSRGRAKQASEIKCDRANTEEIFCRHHLFIHERNEFTLVQYCEAPFTSSPLALEILQ